MDAKYCPTCEGEGQIDVPDTWDVAANGNDSDGPFVCQHAACPTCGGDGLRKAWRAPEMWLAGLSRSKWHAPELVEHEDEGDPSDNHLTWNAVS